jgi:hypothetical protein
MGEEPKASPRRERSLYIRESWEYFNGVYSIDWENFVLEFDSLIGLFVCLPIVIS